MMVKVVVQLNAEKVLAAECKEKVGAIKREHDWRRPAGISKQSWRAWLQEAWAE